MASRTNGRSKDRINKLELVKDAAIQLTTLTGRRPEKVLGFEKSDGGTWRISFEMLELERMPKSTDLLGCYVVEVVTALHVDQEGGVQRHPLVLAGTARNRDRQRLERGDDLPGDVLGAALDTL